MHAGSREQICTIVHHFEATLTSPHFSVSATSLHSLLNSEGAPDLLCFSHLRWHFVTQRPQHLLTRAARDRRVFFWEEPVWHDEAADEASRMRLEVLRESPSLWVLRPHLVRGIDSDSGQRALLNEFVTSFHIERYTLWYYTPMALGFSQQLTPELTVYDCMDELSAFQNAPAQMKERERQLLDKADVVFTGGISLYESKRHQHSNVHAFPSSIDVSHFAQAYGSKGAEPADQAAIPHPRAGFFGVVDERLDVSLLAAVAQLRPDVQFVILGPTVKIDPAHLPQAANIHYLGGKSFDELPSYLAGWDVALLPFALNDATRFISPTKTPEYLAAGKRVVSTPIRDVVRGYGDSGLVAIADTPAAFATAIDRAFDPPADTWSSAVAVKLAESSWDSTWSAMQQLMERARPSISAGCQFVGTGLPESKMAAAEVRGLRSPLPARTAYRPLRTETFDSIVVGAGFAGSVLAERLATQRNERVLVIDKRDHIAGNAYDFCNEDGILIHKYGPHIFHTSSEKVLTYLSRFTSWRPYEHRVLASVAGQLLPIPINMDTINKLYGLDLDAEGVKAFLASRAVKPSVIRTSKDIVISRVGHDLYEKFFRNYTRKQWGVDPSELDASVAGRIPVRFDRDDRYFSDSYQVMPLHGYTRMFERMLDQPNLTVRTGVDYKDLARSYPNTKVIYTGPVDEYFDYRFGVLPYRSLEFRHETHDRELFQPAPVVNYPNEHAYTRITEFKYLTGQKHAKTSIVYEFPQPEGDPYYPIPRPENASLYERYQQLAMRDSRAHFCGRLATYRYLNMDQVVAQALSTFQRIADSTTLDRTLSAPLSTARTLVPTSPE